MNYECCWSDSDPDHWVGIDAGDPADAAETFAAKVCARDNECYLSFASGQLITVRYATSKVHVGLYEVTMESVPHFHASPKAER